MPFPRKRSPIQFSEQEMLKLESIRKSRTEEKRRTLIGQRFFWIHYLARVMKPVRSTTTSAAAP